MFGYLRFVLAFFVLLSHVNVRFFGLNPGVTAVVIFYILAGYVVAHLWEDVISDGRGKVWRFYKDRVLRIFPLYFYVTVLTALFLILTGYGEPRFSLLNIVCNLSILPLNFYMVLDSVILTIPNWCLIPPAWSLGAELQAYILLPLVFMHGRLKAWMVAASFSVYLLANLSLINPDYFGYRLLPGVFFIFVVGSSIKKAENNNKNSALFDRLYPWALWWSVAVLGVVFLCGDSFSTAYTRETFMGLLAGIPAVYAMGHSRVKLPHNAFFGALSYGLFLGHFLVIWWIDYTGCVDKTSVVYIPAITLGSLAISYSGMAIIERHVDPVRRKIKFT